MPSSSVSSAQPSQEPQPFLLPLPRAGDRISYRLSQKEWATLEDGGRIEVDAGTQVSVEVETAILARYIYTRLPQALNDPGNAEWQFLVKAGDSEFWIRPHSDYLYGEYQIWEPVTVNAQPTELSA